MSWIHSMPPNFLALLLHQTFYGPRIPGPRIQMNTKGWKVRSLTALPIPWCPFWWPTSLSQNVTVQRTNTLYYENFIVIISMFFSTEQWQLIHSGIVLLENFSAFFKNENCGPSVVVHLFVAWSRSVTRKHSQAFTKLIYHRISCYLFGCVLAVQQKGLISTIFMYSEVG